MIGNTTAPISAKGEETKPVRFLASSNDLGLIDLQIIGAGRLTMSADKAVDLVWEIINQLKEIANSIEESSA